MIDCIGRSAHTLLGHAILILSFSFPTISHPPETLSLYQQRYLANLFNKWLATVFQQQQSPVKWLRLEWWQGLTRTGILWLTDLWKPFLSFRGHFSCGNSRISSNNKSSYNLPFCEQLIALQMCINQNPAFLTVLYIVKNPKSKRWP